MKKSVLLLLIILTIFLTACSSQPKGPQTSTGKKPQAVKTKAKKPYKPKITYETLEQTETVLFAEQRIQDPNLLKEQTEVRQEGAEGVRVRSFKVTLKDGIEQTRTMEKEEITVQPIPRIIADGTKEPPSDPIVYGTRTGARYHQDHKHAGGCHNYLSRSKIPMTISAAQAQGLTPCQCGSCSW